MFDRLWMTLAQSVISAALLSAVACTEMPAEEQTEEISELATCTIEASQIDGDVAPPAKRRAESAPPPSACEDLNAHLASIAHINGLLETALEEVEP